MFSTATTILAAAKGPKRALALVGLTMSLAGCISPQAGSDGRYANPIGTAPVINNETPYSNALRCVGGYVRREHGAPRVAVGNIRDYTGKIDKDGGAKLTQGASLMAISALAKAGVKLVERYDTSVTELELKYASSKLIGDQGNDQNDGGYRKILAGSIEGSDYYLVGGITELNADIREGGIDGGYSNLNPEGVAGSLTARQYVLNVGLDLRLVDSRTLEVVDVVSYQKQIIGREITAGVFSFFGINTIDIGVGDKAEEPIQLAVRSVIERAVLSMIVPLYHVNPKSCVQFGKDGDPMGEIHYNAPQPRHAADGRQVAQADAPSKPAPQSAPKPLKAPEPQDPYVYYSEPVYTGSLRGTYN